MSKRAATTTLTVDQVTSWLETKASALDAGARIEVGRLIPQFVVEHGTQQDINQLVESMLGGKRSGWQHDELFAALRVAQSATVSKRLLRRLHEGMVARGYYRQVAITLQLLDRRELSSAEKVIMIRAYYDGASSSTDDDRYFSNLLKSLPDTPERRELKRWVARQVERRSWGI